MRGLAGLSVLVTGAAQGIGQAVAQRFAEEGSRVAVNDLRDDAALQRSFASLREVAAGRHAVAAGDVSDEAEVERVFAQAAESLGGIDILVNNAGVQIASPSDSLDVRDFDRVLAINVRGTMLCARAAIRHFLAAGKGGVVLNNSSVHEIVPKPGYLGYSASKGAVGNITRTLALEFADRGIRVNAVGPGATVTPINAAWTGDPSQRRVVERHIPMQRVAKAAEIAAVFAFLASDDASYITGQTIYVDGGLTLYGDFRENWAS